MASSPKAHRTHNKRIVTDEYSPRNVAYTITHELVRCECNWFGWIPKKELMD